MTERFYRKVRLEVKDLSLYKDYKSEGVLCGKNRDINRVILEVLFFKFEWSLVDNKFRCDGINCK
jgi:hypothetical protein